MLTLNDLHDHFASIPRDFDLIINDQSFKCNKLVMCAFSKVISLNSQSSSSYSCNIPTNNEAINTVIDFLHGGNVNFSENPYQIYLIAAYLDISILKQRLCDIIESSTTTANFEERYNTLNLFPFYCDPLFHFFINNKDYFNTFSKSHTLPLSFANSFLASSPNFFTSEDEKVFFILGILKNVNDSNVDENDFSIVSHINLCNLTDDSLYSFLNHPLSPKFSPYLNSFPLFEKQVRIISDNKKKLLNLQKEATDVQSVNENESNTNNSLSNEFNSLNARLFNLDIQRFDFRQKIEDIVNLIREARTLLQAIQQRNNEYLPFLEAVNKMNATSVKLVDVLQNFYNIGGKTIYPGSSRDALKHSKEWKTECVKLKERIPGIIVQEQLTSYFQALDETENILLSLMPVMNPDSISKDKKK